MADHYRQFSAAVRLRGELAAAWIADSLRNRRRQRQQLVDAGYEQAAKEIGIDFDCEIDDDGWLCITDDRGNGDVMHAASFLRELVRLRYVDEPVAIQWADTCSKQQPDGFTGGAAIVTRRAVRWIVLPELVDQRLRSIERRIVKTAKKRA